MSPVEQDVLRYLDGQDHAYNMTGIVTVLGANWTSAEVVDAVRALYDGGRINRIGVMGPNKPYYVYYSLFIRTASGYVAREEPEPAAGPEPTPALTAEQRDTLISRLEADLAPPSEIVVERRAGDRRAPRYGVLEVISRWRLPYRLSRVIEIVGNSRGARLGVEDARQVVRLIRDHVRDQEEA